MKNIFQMPSTENIDFEALEDTCLPKIAYYSKPIDPRRTAINEAHALEQVIFGESLYGKNVRIPSVKANWKQRQKKLTSFSRDDLTYSPQIEKAIENSKSILQLPENWDEEGSPRYSEDTWERATRFIRKTAFQFKQESESWISPPKITPSHDGSIDVRWRIGKRSLLINFPNELNTPPSFFGSDKTTDTIKGTLNLFSQNHWLLKWLLR